MKQRNSLSYGALALTLAVAFLFVIRGDSVFAGSVHFGGESAPSVTPNLAGRDGPWVNVREYGAKGDGNTDDTAAINRAMRALPARGGVVFFPPGIYLTTGITIKDKPVELVGSGGSCDLESPDTRLLPLDCPTVIRSITNAPIVKFTVTDRNGNLATRFAVGLRDIAIQGNGCGNLGSPVSVDACRPGNVPWPTINDQHCLQVDNRGFEAYDVTLLQCSGHGLYLTDSVDSNFFNLRIGFANGDGINMDGSELTDTHIFGGSSLGNGSDGIHMVRASGTSTFGFTVEQNYGYGIDLEGSGGSSGYVRFSRFMSVWDERNYAGSVHFNANAFDNLVDYLRYSSGPPVFDATYNRNLVWGSNFTSSETGNAADITPTSMTIESTTPWVWVGFAVIVGNARAVIDGYTNPSTVRFSEGWKNAAGESVPDPPPGGYQIGPQSACSAGGGCAVGDGLLKQQIGTIVTGGGVNSSEFDILRIRRTNGEPGDVSGGVFQGSRFLAGERFELFRDSAGGELVLWDTDRLATGGSVANLEAQGGRTLQLNAPQIMFATGQFERVRVDDTGNVGIGTTAPRSRLQVAGGYIQFPTISGSDPPAADCDSADEAGRMVVRTDGPTNLYVCVGEAGWVGR